MFVFAVTLEGATFSHLLEHAKQFRDTLTLARYIKRSLNCHAQNILFIINCALWNMHYVCEYSNSTNNMFYVQKCDIHDTGNKRVTLHANGDYHDFHKDLKQLFWKEASGSIPVNLGSACRCVQFWYIFNVTLKFCFCFSLTCLFHFELLPTRCNVVYIHFYSFLACSFLIPK